MEKLLENWGKVQDILKNELTHPSYTTWIKPMKPVQLNLDSSVIYIKADPSFMSNHNTRDRYTDIIRSSVAEVFGIPLDIIFILSENEIDEDGNLQEKNSETLNPRYKFETFIVGDNNQFANAASFTVAEAPGQSYNPLFIYGSAGLGKTHLMHAIGNYIEETQPSLNVLYVSSETFTNEFINSLPIGGMRGSGKVKDNMIFKSKYRNVDVLLIDDIQFIEKKPETQNELFHTFNNLYESNKQIIFSSDRPPKDIPTLDERLKSRFEWGLVADIQPPDFETKVAILRNKAKQDNLTLDKDLLEVINLISEKIKSNIRELEGAFNRVVAFGSLMNKKMNKELVHMVLKDIFSESDLQPTPDSIKKKVCKKFDIKIIDIESKKKARKFSYPRQIAMYLCREMTNLSLPKIGEYFGNRDHTTVLHACEKITTERLNSDSLKDLLINLESEIRGS